MRHVESEQLLRYADGELPAREAREVRAHLEACWQCRTELEHLQETVGECVRYRALLAEHLPPPPAPWMNIYRRFEQMDARPARPPLMVRLCAAAAGAGVARWAPAAVALTLVCALVVYEWRNAPSVQAAVLLRKAVEAAEERSPAPHRLRIRTKQREVSRMVAAAQPASVDPAANETLANLEALFRAANYNWDDPLSARSFQAWRGGLEDKRDEVADLGDCYRIRTTAETGELMQATLKLDARDLRPIESRLEFRNSEWVEITEIAVAPATPPAPVAVAASRPPAAPGRVVETAPRAATLSDELQVLAALHQVGADLGDPVEVTRAAGRILVSGVGVAPERRRRIEDALDDLPNVVVRFSDPGDAEPLPPAYISERAVGGGRPAFDARLAEQLGGRLHFERLAAELLDRSEAMMSRAYALRRLAHRFPPEAESQLAAADLVLLRGLGREHAVALAEQAAAMERLLVPALEPLGGTLPGALPDIAPLPWQPAAEEIFRTARQVETLLASMLGAASGQVPAAGLPSQLLAGMAELRARVDTYVGWRGAPPPREAGAARR